ncbi:MAG: HXXEE domain-containing protein [Bacteroidaceae bacterium]
MMSALAILYLVLPFPIAFMIHETEEILTQSRWMKKHKASIMERFPQWNRMITHLGNLSNMAFVIAVLEELLLIMAVTCYVLTQGMFALGIWSAVFMAFSLHQLGHISMSLLLRSYTPGLTTSLLLLPYASYGVWSIYLVMSVGQMLVWGFAGVLLMILNLRFAHWVGTKLGKIIRF